MTYAKLRRKWLRVQNQMKEVDVLRNQHIISQEVYLRRSMILIIRMGRLEKKMVAALKAREQANQQQ